MIEIKKATNQISNCNVCGAINFDSELSMNRKVDNLTEILIGRSLNQQVTLCDDCLRELLKKITDYIFPNHGDLIDRNVLIDKLSKREYCKRCNNNMNGIMCTVCIKRNTDDRAIDYLYGEEVIIEATE